MLKKISFCVFLALFCVSFAFSQKPFVSGLSYSHLKAVLVQVGISKDSTHNGYKTIVTVEKNGVAESKDVTNSFPSSSAFREECIVLDFSDVSTLFPDPNDPNDYFTSSTKVAITLIDANLNVIFSKRVDAGNISAHPFQTIILGQGVVDNNQNDAPDLSIKLNVNTPSPIRTADFVLVVRTFPIDCFYSSLSFSCGDLDMGLADAILDRLTRVVLPVDFISCEAKNISRSQTEVTWVTASETNNQYFSIFRSIDAVNWTQIGQVVGSGNTKNQTRHTFIDPKPLARCYYKVVSSDKKSSKIVSVACDNCQERAFVLFENSITNNGVREVVYLYGTVGNLIYNGEYPESLKLPSGLIILSTHDGFSKKFMVVR